MDKKDLYTRVFLKAASLPHDDEAIKDKKIAWWFNIRSKPVGGLRLTDDGIDFIQNESKIKTYSAELPSDLKITSQILVWLDNFIECPYHFSKKNITVTEERIAFELHLFSGDVQKLGYSKAMAKRFNQELTT
jgi:regulatory protein YycI of two-component signal transduction system YycFG